MAIQKDDVGRWIVKATTPEDMKEIIVEWLQKQAIGASTDMRLAKTRKREYECKAKRDALEGAAQFLNNVMVIK